MRRKDVRLMSQDKFAALHFAIFDQQLQQEVARGVVPYLADTFGLGYFFGNDARSCLDGISVEVFVVGVSELPKDTWREVIDTCQSKQQPCGVIMRTQDPAKWRQLAQMHQQRSFAFIVAVGGPRSDFKQMFPMTPILCDVSDLTIPGPQIARFMDSIVHTQREGRKADARAKAAV